jgi:hypothetical protein
MGVSAGWDYGFWQMHDSNISGVLSFAIREKRYPYCCCFMLFIIRPLPSIPHHTSFCSSKVVKCIISFS